MIRCVVIDDEPLAGQLLASYIEKVEDLVLVNSFTNALEAWTFLQKEQIDLIFLDIQMPELNGVQLAKLIGDQARVIFTTAYPDYAVEGFELKALDYLVKPISLQRFLSAINRYNEHSAIKPVSTLKEASSYIFVKTEYRHQKIAFDEILYLKGMGDYVSIHTEKDRIMTLENMKSFELKLPKERFIRVHKSYIISLEKLEFVERNRAKIREELIPIGATYQADFWARLKT